MHGVNKSTSLGQQRIKPLTKPLKLGRYSMCLYPLKKKEKITMRSLTSRPHPRLAIVVISSRTAPAPTRQRAVDLGQTQRRLARRPAGMEGSPPRNESGPNDGRTNERTARRGPRSTNNCKPANSSCDQTKQRTTEHRPQATDHWPQTTGHRPLTNPLNSPPTRQQPVSHHPWT